MKRLLLALICSSLSVCFGQINPSDGCPTLAVLPVNATCVSNTYFMNGSFTNGALTAPTCSAGTNRDDGWYAFVATAANITIEEVSSDRWHLIQVWDGCGTGVGSHGCVVNANGTTNVLNLTGLTIGTTYYIQLQRRSGWNSSSMNGTICLYETQDPDVPWPGADLGTLGCTSTTNVTGSTSGANVDCAVSSAGDHIYEFTLANDADVTFDLCSSSYDTEIHLINILTGSCDAGVIGTNDDFCGVQSSLTMTCLTAGTYVIVVEGSGAAEGAYDMNIVVSNCSCTAPPNDSPCTATVLPVGSPTCIFTSDDNTGANDSGVGSPGCASYSGADLWYSVTVPASGELVFETASGTMTDAGMAIYNGTCGAPNLISCDDNSGTGNMPYIEDWSLTPGETIYIRVWQNGGGTGTYDICVHEPDCSANITNDFCEDPGTLTESAGDSFSSSTAALYTYDNPDGVESVFCGTIQNNSWYSFVATSTTEVFDITSVSGCTNGIQAEVYSYNSAGSCCSNFTSVSNCFNPATASTGTVTAIGLTIGETYILMIDGWAGANCDFTIDGWSAIGVLPVELVDFEGSALIDRNLLSWKTKSESNSEWFVIEKSMDGMQFQEIGKVGAAGNSSSELSYKYEDYEIGYAEVYYRLKQLDQDGTVTKSKVVHISREGDNVLIYPNPTSGEINFNFLPNYVGDFTITYTDLLGRKVTEQARITSVNSSFKSDALTNFKAGLYLVEVQDALGNIITLQRILRE